MEFNTQSAMTDTSDFWPKELGDPDVPEGTPEYVTKSNPGWTHQHTVRPKQPDPTPGREKLELALRQVEGSILDTFSPGIQNAIRDCVNQLATAYEDMGQKYLPAFMDLTCDTWISRKEVGTELTRLVGDAGIDILRAAVFSGRVKDVCYASLEYGRVQDGERLVFSASVDPKTESLEVVMATIEAALKDAWVTGEA